MAQHHEPVGVGERQVVQRQLFALGVESSFDLVEALRLEAGRVIEVAPGSAGIHYELAGTFKSLDMMDEAIQHLRIVLHLDPGVAFGTGTHATTHLCLEWIDAHDLAGREVLDFGCGSGVLALGAALAAGLPDTVAGYQLNRFCASGLEAVNTGAQKVASGWDDLILAGGVEAMSRIPMGSDGGAWAMDPITNYETGFVPQGIGADLIATIGGGSITDCVARSPKSPPPRTLRFLRQSPPPPGAVDWL